MPHKRYIIFCDESDDKGRFYSNFYGGALIEASKQQALEAELQAIKDDLHIFNGEMKWERITEPYADKYITFVNAVFDIVARGEMKIRIMFTQNRYRPILDEYQNWKRLLSSILSIYKACIWFAAFGLRQVHRFSRPIVRRRSS